MINTLFYLALSLDSGCIVVDHQQLQAKDLASRIPVFQKLPRETVLAPAPYFGVRRDLAGTTLRRWAEGFGLETSELEPLCIYRKAANAAEVPWETDLHEALEKLLGWKPSAGELEILERHLAAGPPGKLILERPGLVFESASKTYLWRGKLAGEGGYAAAKLRFRILRKQMVLVTARPLAAGKPLTAEDVETIEVPFRPESIRMESTLALPLGQVLRRSLPKGTTLLAQHLTEAPMILAGDAVELFSTAGQATIRTPAVARGKAKLGDPILVSTLEGKRLLRAIAVAPGKVEIHAGPAGIKATGKLTQ